MKKLVFCVLALLFFAGISAGQTKSLKKSPALTEAAPETVGISPDRLARIDRMCAETVQNGNLPGIAALVIRNGKIVMWKAYGMADSQSGRPLKRDDIFRIASQTKAITSTAVMMLWEEGKFQLDDPVSRYIPEFKNVQVLKSFNYSDTTWTGEPAKPEITIRHLLTHTSGIGYGAIDPDERFRLLYRKAGIIDAFTTGNITIAENIKKLAILPLHNNPGEKFIYSEGLDVLGYFIEVVSGMPFDQFLKTRIFDPLGMSDTWFYLPEEKAGRLVSLQYQNKGKWERIPSTYFESDYPVKGARTFFSGGGGLSSTLKDYATFLQMYLNGGEINGIRLLSRTTVECIMGNQTGSLYGSPDKFFGLGFSILTPAGQDKGGLLSEGTFEWGGAFNTQYFADPQEKIIGLIFKQTSGPVNDNTAWKFKQLIGQSIDD
jgi:CubicO group peptidase (beta-lactamase class C family)